LRGSYPKAAFFFDDLKNVAEFLVVFQLNRICNRSFVFIPYQNCFHKIILYEWLDNEISFRS